LFSDSESVNADNRRSAEEAIAVSHVLQTLLGISVLCRLSPLRHVPCVRQVRQ